MVQAFPGALAVFDDQRRYLAASERWRRDFGLGGPVLAGQEVSPAFLPAWREVHAAALRGHTTQREDDVYERTDGAVRRVSWTVAPWRTNDGAIAGVLIHAEDVTQRRQLQDQRRARQEQHEEQRHRQTLERLHGQFVDAVTHELRTPLAAIVGCAELLEDQAGGVLTLAGLAMVSEIQGAARRLEVLLDDLIDFTRMEAGTFQLDLQPVELRHLIAEVVLGFDHQAAQAGVAVKVSTGPDEAMVVADHRRLRQVLGHLLHNALKFSPRGALVHVTLRVEAEAVVCEVSDAGEGVTPARQARLFERFTQLEGGQRQGKGLGLGLYVCRTLLEAHCGTIGVRSQPGEGATFWLRVPRLLADET